MTGRRCNRALQHIVLNAPVVGARRPYRSTEKPRWSSADRAALAERLPARFATLVPSAMRGEPEIERLIMIRPINLTASVRTTTSLRGLPICASCTTGSVIPGSLPPIMQGRNGMRCISLVDVDCRSKRDTILCPPRCSPRCRWQVAHL